MPEVDYDFAFWFVEQFGPTSEWQAEIISRMAHGEKMPEIKLTNSNRCYACEGAIKLGYPDCHYHYVNRKKVSDYHVQDDPALD